MSRTAWSRSSGLYLGSKGRPGIVNIFVWLLLLCFCTCRGLNAFAMVPNNLSWLKNLFEANHFRKAKESNANRSKTSDVWGNSHARTRRDSARMGRPGRSWRSSTCGGEGDVRPDSAPNAETTNCAGGSRQFLACKTGWALCGRGGRLTESGLGLDSHVMGDIMMSSITFRSASKIYLFRESRRESQ
jgi:hypothetical protein